MKQVVKLCLTVLIVTLAGCQSNWQEFRDEEGGFSVKVPGKVYSKPNIPQEGRTGGQVHMVNIEDAKYVILYIDIVLPGNRDLTESEIDSLKKFIIQDLENPNQVLPINYEDIDVLGYPGLRIEWPTGNGTFVTEVFFVGRRQYQLGVNFVLGYPEKDVKKFFSSFRLM